MWERQTITVFLITTGSFLQDSFNCASGCDSVDDGFELSFVWIGSSGIPTSGHPWPVLSIAEGRVGVVIVRSVCSTDCGEYLPAN